MRPRHSASARGARRSERYRTWGAAARRKARVSATGPRARQLPGDERSASSRDRPHSIKSIPVLSWITGGVNDEGATPWWPPVVRIRRAPGAPRRYAEPPRTAALAATSAGASQ